MPHPFPVLDTESGALVMVDHYSIGEVAAMFGVSISTARRRVKSGEWTVWEPMAGVFWMTPEHVAEARERDTHHARPAVPECPEAGPPRLGVPVNPEDLEGME